jgi:RES domain
VGQRRGKKKKASRRLRFNVYRGVQGSWPTIGPGELLLEYFSDNELVGWRSRGKDLQDYHYLWFFELESQRATHHQRMLEALRSVPGTTVSLDAWGRAMAYKYSDAPLSCIGSLKWVGGRFNYGVDIDASRFTPFPALYLAQDAETGFREMNGLVRGTERSGLNASELALCTESSITWVAVEGAVNNIFDVTRAANLRAFADVLNTFKLSRNVRDVEAKLNATPLRLARTAKELQRSFMSENWRELPTLFSTPANSQLFGHLLTHAGFEGVLYSSTITGRRNLALFPRQLQNSSSVVRVVGPPAVARCVELSAATYGDAEREGPS